MDAPYPRSCCFEAWLSDLSAWARGERVRQGWSLGTVIAGGHGYILVLLWGSGLYGITYLANLPYGYGKLPSKAPGLGNAALVMP